MTSPLRTPFALAATLMLSACATVENVPLRFLPEQAYQDSSASAYLWTSGMSRQRAFSMKDWATVTRIDNVAIPSPYRPPAGAAPAAWLMELPAGRHVVEILDKEVSMASFLTALVGWDTVVAERSRHSMEFVAAPNRMYTPFVDDRCARKWFWIGDSDRYVPRSKTLKPALPPHEAAAYVAGEVPGESGCTSNTSR